MKTMRDAQLDGMITGTSATALRQVPPEYDTDGLREAWLREFDVMQQAIGVWSPVVQAQPEKPKTKGRVKKVVGAEPTPPPAKKSMMAVFEDSLV